MSEKLAVGMSVAIPAIVILIVAGCIFWFLIKPSWDMRRLQARADAGDPQAQAQLARANSMLDAMRRATGAEDPERARLLQSGRAARAVIVDVRPLGIQVKAGPLPMQLMEVELDVEGGTRVTVRDPVNQANLGRLLKGATVPVRVDPMDPKRLVVLWDTL
ncbi:hypothetical protein [Chondromyces apiculatus]|uniref:Uncharacterized protein n=1 Tax=Chondromyces apiculatus DSM 436 TaxID=1192034 RepID=A0A017T8D9_9BACT|nr:hypothetical protein [Chondromyces apiculatus]EYF05504.1 Hypothetical protein CAP_3232 [Chondromyces apiculatus DSM 436]